MNASILIPLGILFSLLGSFCLFLFAVWGRSQPAENRRGNWLPVAGFVLLNAWWLGLAALVFIKFFILGEDT